MTPLLICVALDLEARGLARRLGLSDSGDRPLPMYGAGAVRIVCVGFRASALDRLDDMLAGTRGGADAATVISAGTCGALSPSLGEGDLVVPAEVITPARARHVTAPLHGLAAHGALLSVADAVTSAPEKARLWLATGATAVDMESASIVAWATARGLRGAVVRGVADTAEAGIPVELAGAVSADGRVRTMSALRAMLARPAVLPRALALRAGTNAALDTVAGALARVVR